MEKNVSEPIAMQTREESELHEKIVNVLGSVLDPGTGLDVLRMGVVPNTIVHKKGQEYMATLTFRPSSPVCPMAFKLAWEMKKAVETVDGIEMVEIKVEGYNRASELEAVLRNKGDNEAETEKGV
jgi:metal-sulfur cluster biosynthetic enzyme